MQSHPCGSLDVLVVHYLLLVCYWFYFTLQTFATNLPSFTNLCRQPLHHFLYGVTNSIRQCLRMLLISLRNLTQNLDQPPVDHFQPSSIFISTFFPKMKKILLYRWICSNMCIYNKVHLFLGKNFYLKKYICYKKLYKDVHWSFSY